MAKERKTINVSLQSKKYLESVNKILNEWEDESLNLSTQICETLLLVDKLKKSATFANVMAMYELIERMMKVYHIEDETQLNAIFAEVVQIDNAKLTQLLSHLNQKTEIKETSFVKKTPEPVITQPIKNEDVPEIVERKPEIKPEIKQEEKLEETSITSTTQANEELATTEDFEVPLDFLLNG